MLYICLRQNTGLSPNLNYFQTTHDMQEIPIYNNIEGLIFDLDGTIADTMPAHFIAWRDTCKKYGINFTPELFGRLAGIPLYGTVEKLNEIFNKDVDPVKVGDEKEELFLRSLEETKVIEPIADVIRRYYGKLPMSVGTGGHRDVAEKTLKIIGMDGFFDILVSSDDIQHPKPHPETFLKCAEKMGVEPSKCQVFEDGILGMIAAKKAGMQLIDVTKYYQVTIGQ